MKTKIIAKLLSILNFLSASRGIHSKAESSVFPIYCISLHRFRQAWGLKTVQGCRIFWKLESPLLAFGHNLDRTLNSMDRFLHLYSFFWQPTAKSLLNWQIQLYYEELKQNQCSSLYFIGQQFFEKQWKVGWLHLLGTCF